MVLYEDDIIIYAKDMESIKEALKMIMCYCAASGSQINKEKTIIISLQQNKTSLSSLKNISILKHGEKFKYLCSMFKIGYELHAAWRHEQEDNLVNKLCKRSHVLLNMQRRSLVMY